ncbi:kelch repeat-containing protein [Paludibacter sp.]|uniref:Kelch repeat-containing protein n=1 Tax=Paludibacter sp. TaxID=1898105 RepID=UPI0013553C5C|nr:kelch repeat-containing protein [Paludibacter sp.]MTK52789.1 hypothetical protein [Paludibacter sp.]
MKFLRLSIYIAIPILLFIACNNEKLLERMPFTYIQKNTIPDGGRASAIAFAIAGKGYVALGRNRNGSFLNDCWQYDPATNNWTKRNSFPGKARVKAIAAVANGYAYIGLGYLGLAGGYADSANYATDFWQYDPNYDQWTRKADFPSKFTDACASFVYNNEIYVGSGFNGNGSTCKFWKYLPAEDRWMPLNMFMGESREIAVACNGDNHCYFGTGYQCKSYNDWWEYSPGTDSWKQRQPMPDHGRQNTLAIAVGDRYFVCAGRYWRGSVTANQYLRADVKEYDPSANQWIDRGEIPNGKRENAVAFTINGTVYLGLGEDDNGLVNSFWSFTP